MLDFAHEQEEICIGGKEPLLVPAEGSKPRSNWVQGGGEQFAHLKLGGTYGRGGKKNRRHRNVEKKQKKQRERVEKGWYINPRGEGTGEVGRES